MDTPSPRKGPRPPFPASPFTAANFAALVALPCLLMVIRVLYRVGSRRG